MLVGVYVHVKKQHGLAVVERWLIQLNACVAVITEVLQQKVAQMSAQQPAARAK